MGVIITGVIESLDVISRIESHHPNLSAESLKSIKSVQNRLFTNI